jgi:hypothetical protein
MHSNNQTLNDILNKIPGWRILKVIVNITFIVVVVYSLYTFRIIIKNIIIGLVAI